MVIMARDNQCIQNSTQCVEWENEHAERTFFWKFHPSLYRDNSLDKRRFDKTCGDLENFLEQKNIQHKEAAPYFTVYPRNMEQTKEFLEYVIPVMLDEHTKNTGVIDKEGYCSHVLHKITEGLYAKHEISIADFEKFKDEVSGVVSQFTPYELRKAKEECGEDIMKAPEKINIANKQLCRIIEKNCITPAYSRKQSEINNSIPLLFEENICTNLRDELYDRFYLPNPQTDNGSREFGDCGLDDEEKTELRNFIEAQNAMKKRPEFREIEKISRNAIDKYYANRKLPENYWIND